MNIDTFLKKFDAISFGLGITVAFIGLILFQLASNDKVEVNLESVRWVAPDGIKRPAPSGVNRLPKTPPPRKGPPPPSRTPSGAKESKPSGSKTVAEANSSVTPKRSPPIPSR